MNINVTMAPEAPEAVSLAPQTVEVFGFKVPVLRYYLHRGHTWACLESDGRVRIGVDDFSQKILGVADAIELPRVGDTYYQNHVCFALLRQGHKAKFLAPVDGVVDQINEAAVRQPQLVHDDPYGEGWLLLVRPTNLEQNLGQLLGGEAAVAWIEAEAHKLLNLMGSETAVTLPDGGAVIDDVYGHFPEVGWRRLVREFFLHELTKTWKKRY